MTLSAQLTVAATAVLLSSTLIEVYPSSILLRLQRSLESHLYTLQSRRRETELAPFIIFIGPSLPSPPIYACCLEIGVEWSAWWNALRSVLFDNIQETSHGVYIFVMEGKIVLLGNNGHDIWSFSLNSKRSPLRSPVLLIGSRASKFIQLKCLNNSNCADFLAERAGRANITVYNPSQPASGRASLISEGDLDGKARSSRENLDRLALPKLVNVRWTQRLDALNAFDPFPSKFTIVGRSTFLSSGTDDSSATCFPAAEYLAKTFQGDAVAMDIESDAESPLLLFSGMSRTMSSGSAPSSMPSVPSFRSSSSSAQSSPLCSTPELPPVTFPSLSHSVSPSLYGGISGPFILDTYTENQTHSVSPSESFLAGMTLDCKTSQINPTPNIPVTRPNYKHQTSSRSSSTAPSSSQSNASAGKSQPSYLSRSQRRLARTVTNPSRYEVQNYLYQGGQTGVVSGGVMLGLRPPEDKSDKLPHHSSSKGQNQHWKMKKAQERKASEPRVKTEA
ncbi:hypothetical protein GYMLUDRAFT_35625 [Collybiopsis luxurians FD-317 M1]|nr:hypothetical protein GYMLUDRAFT_35625 [Collybiopsis luxurians FD-317 M1]